MPAPTMATDSFLLLIFVPDLADVGVPRLRRAAPYKVRRHLGHAKGNVGRSESGHRCPGRKYGKTAKRQKDLPRRAWSTRHYVGAKSNQTRPGRRARENTRTTR